MIHSHRSLIVTTLVAAGLFAASGAVTFAAPPPDKAAHEAHGKAAGEHQKKQHHHNNGKQLLGDKVKTNGHHVIDQKGNVTASVDVQNGKVAGLHAKHAQKGELPVKKYKTNQKMAQADDFTGTPRLMTVQEYVGTTYIGYSYIDDYGNEEIYWFPYDMILDGDTGAIEYVPADAA